MTMVLAGTTLLAIGWAVWMNQRLSRCERRLRGQQRRTRRAEKSLRELSESAADVETHAANERMRLAIKTSGVGVWDWLINDGIVIWDDTMRSLYGFDPRDNVVATDAWQKALHPDDLKKTEELIWEAVKKNTDFYAEFRIILPDGRIRVLEGAGVCLRDESGTPYRMLGTNKDITEFREAEEALRENEQLFRGAFGESPIGMAVVGLGGEWQKVNKAICNLVGYSEEELTVSRFQDITHPDDVDADLTLMRALLAGTINHYEMEKRYIHKDGYPIWVLLSGSLVRNKDGSPSYFVALIVDITGRKQAEEQLRLLEERWQFALEGSLAAVWDYNLTLNELTLSDRWQMMLGYGDDPIKPSMKNMRALVHPEDLPMVQKNF